MGKPATHIPDHLGHRQVRLVPQVAGELCHLGDDEPHGGDHAACKLCHNGSYTSQGTQGALAKPANHIPEVQLLNGAAMDCNACHTEHHRRGPR